MFAARKLVMLVVVVITVVVLVGLLLTQRNVMMQSHIKSNEDTVVAKPSLEILSDRIITRVTASKALHPATTTPLDPDGPQSDWFYSEPIVLPDDIIISGFAVEIENDDFSTLHHVSVGVLSRLATLCTIHFLQANGMHEFFTASRNTPDPFMLDKPYGIYWRAGEPLEVEYMTHPVATPHGFHTASETIQPTLKVTLFTDQSRTVEARYLRLRLDDTPCEKPLAHQAFVVPADGKEFTKYADISGGSARYTFPKAGQILGGGGNFWPRKGGQNVIAYLNDKEIDVSEASSGETDWKWRIPHHTLNLPFESGDTITISSKYLNPFTEPVKDASGMYGLYYTFEEPIILGTTSPSNLQ